MRLRGTRRLPPSPRLGRMREQPTSSPTTSRRHPVCNLASLPDPSLESLVVCRDAGEHFQNGIESTLLIIRKESLEYPLPIPNIHPWLYLPEELDKRFFAFIWQKCINTRNRISVLLSVKGVDLGPQLRSCLKGPISTPPQRLAENVKVGVSDQNEDSAITWTRVKILPRPEEWLRDMKH